MTLWILPKTIAKHQRSAGKTFNKIYTESTTKELKSSCKTYDMEKTYELCPECGEEVELTTVKPCYIIRRSDDEGNDEDRVSLLNKGNGGIFLHANISTN